METAVETVDTNPQTSEPQSNADVKVTSSADVKPQSTSWSDSLDADLKDYAHTKGFQDPKTILESYRNLEKLRGVPQERLLKLPETPDAPEWNDVYTKLGKPGSAEEYGIEVDKDNPAFGEWAKETFHGLNLTKDQANALLAKYNDFVTIQHNESAEQFNQRVAEQEKVLRKEWGAAYEQNKARAQRAYREFGLPDEAVDALERVMGHDGVMKFMSRLGERIGEHEYAGGQSASSSSTIYTPEQAMARISNLKKDSEWTAKFLNGGIKEREEMERLMKMANPSD